MRVYTRAGDGGTTGMFLGGRVSKADAVIEACGDVDEAVCVLGVARASCADPRIGDEVFKRQRELFVVAADLATNPAHRDRLLPKVSLVTREMVDEVEAEIDRLLAERPLRPVFVVPGAGVTSAALDHARSVIRRAERRVVGLREVGHEVNPAATAYLNRLSDLVFVLARGAAVGAEAASRD